MDSILSNRSSSVIPVPIPRRKHGRGRPRPLSSQPAMSARCCLRYFARTTSRKQVIADVSFNDQTIEIDHRLVELCSAGVTQFTVHSLILIDVHRRTFRSRKFRLLSIEEFWPEAQGPFDPDPQAVQDNGG